MFINKQKTDFRVNIDKISCDCYVRLHEKIDKKGLKHKFLQN